MFAGGVRRHDRAHAVKWCSLTRKWENTFQVFYPAISVLLCISWCTAAKSFIFYAVLSSGRECNILTHPIIMSDDVDYFLSKKVSRVTETTLVAFMFEASATLQLHVPNCKPCRNEYVKFSGLGERKSRKWNRDRYKMFPSIKLSFSMRLRNNMKRVADLSTSE